MIGESVIDIGDPMGGDVVRKDMFLFEIDEIDISRDCDPGIITYRLRDSSSSENPYEAMGLNALSTHDRPIPYRLFWGRPRY